jgi:hypothetical protein
MIRSRGVLRFAAAIALVGGSYAVAQSAAVGVAASVIGEVKFSNAQVTRARPVAIRQRIALGDLIQTGKASQMQLLLLDRSNFSIGANASLRIDRFIYDPARGRTSGASVARGAFRFMSGQQNRGNSGTIASPVATIGIRGTILDGVVGEAAREIAKGEIKEVKKADADKQTATLVVLRGPGSRTQPGADVGAASVTSGGVTVELTRPMQAAFVPRAGAAPIGPFALSPGGLAALQGQVFPRQAQGGSAAGSILGGLLRVLPGVIGTGRSSSGSGSPNDPAGKPPGKP